MDPSDLATCYDSCMLRSVLEEELEETCNQICVEDIGLLEKFVTVFLQF